MEFCRNDQPELNFQEPIDGKYRYITRNYALDLI